MTRNRIRTISKERRAMKQLVQAGMAKMPQGKPTGIRGLRIKGKSLSETVLEDRR